MPATGQISNVSAFVLPEPAGMADHGQESMFPELDKLLELERLRLERERLRLVRHQSKAKHKHHSRPPKDEYRPQNKALREYETCRKTFLGWERTIREVVGADGEVTPEAIYADALGPSPKTQQRVMERFGLHWERDWPPSTWPLNAPNGQI